LLDFHFSRHCGWLADRVKRTFLLQRASLTGGGNLPDASIAIMKSMQ
jgi:hypothetical protein